MAINPPEVNGIVSAHEYKNRCKRTGLTGLNKRKHSLVERVYNSLKTIEGIRSVPTPDNIMPLRQVRRVVYRALDGENNTFLSGLDKKITEEVGQALSNRILELAALLPFNHRGPSRQEYMTTIENRQTKNAERDIHHREFLSFHDTTKYANPEQANGGGFRSIQDGYSLERALSSHMPGRVYRTWLNTQTNINFNNWKDTVYLWMSEDGAAGPHGNGGDIRGVTYLDIVQRQDYQVRIDAGRMYDHNRDLMHTGDMESQGGMNKGWGIFVIDFHGRMYIGDHSSNTFHHSSFLSGDPVASAGEIAVDKGIVVGITNKTGHYRAGPKELLEALKVFQIGGINLQTVLVSDSFKDRTNSKWYKANEVMAANGDVNGACNRFCVTAIS